jgi:hypothetical protein
MNGQPQAAKEKKYMVKHKAMKTKLVILLFIVSTSVFSQNKTIVPVSGAIVFVKEERILDKDLYLKSWKEFMPKMQKAIEEQIYLERLTDGKVTDTTQLKLASLTMSENFEMMLPILLEEEKQDFKFYHEFKNDSIIKYVTLDGQLINSRILIDKVSGTVTNEFDEQVIVEKNEILKLTVFKDQIKSINGYNCFKVIYTSNESSQSDLNFMSSILTTTRELWVTDKIKCNYHPVIDESEILEKYYPLEIIEYSDSLKGFETLYKLEKLEIK